MIFMKDERSKVRTLQARILEKARIYMALGVFYLGCCWLGIIFQYSAIKDILTPENQKLSVIL